MSLGRLGVWLIVLIALNGCDFLSNSDEEFSPGSPIKGTEEVINNSESISLDGHPRISPDGKTLAFRWSEDEEGTNGVYLQNIGSLARRYLVRGYSPDWSPDGEWIVFDSGDYNLGKIRVDGSSLTQLTSNGRSLEPAWSPDGQTIAYYVEMGSETTAGIATVTTDGILGPRLFLGGSPDWFPDGRLFATLGRSNAFLVYDRRASRLDTIKGIPDQARYPQVSPDGTRITFLADGIWLCNSDGSDLRQIVRSDGDELGRGGDPKILVGAPSWHPDGLHVVFEHVRITSHTYGGHGPIVSGEYSIRLLNVGGF